MEIASPPLHVWETWLTVSILTSHGVERDFVLKLEKGDSLVMTAKTIAVTEAGPPPIISLFTRTWVQVVTSCQRRVAVDPRTGLELFDPVTRRPYVEPVEEAPDGDDAAA